MIKIGIYGATGYTGLELLRLLQRHPAAEIVWLTSENSAGQQFGDVFTVPPTIGKHALVASAAADLSAVDLVFCCLPHAVSLEPVAKARAAGVKVIDLSADYRLKDPAIYEKTYNHAHTQRELLAQAVYGLPELHRAEIAGASLVANPGCYPTSVILGLAPLAQAGWLAGTVISDSKSGSLRRGPLAEPQNAFRRGKREREPVQHRARASTSAGDGAGAGGNQQVSKSARIAQMADHLLAASDADQPRDAVYDLCGAAGRRERGRCPGGL